MVSLDKAVIVRYERAGLKFEILVDPDLAWELRRGKDVDIDEMLAAPEIFRDVRRGDRASEEELHKAFGTTDVYEIAKTIVKKGEFHLTTEQRRKLTEEMKKKIASLISKRGVDPRTGLPHPPERILRAMEEARVHIDIFKTPEEQIQTVIDRIKRILPIKIEVRKLRILIPPQWVGRVYGRIKSFKMVRERYLGDGTLEVILEVPAGSVGDVIKTIGDLTKGEARVEME